MSFFLWFNKDCPQTKKTFTCMQFTFLPLRPLRSPIIEDVFFDNQELLDLDQIGLPDVLSPSNIKTDYRKSPPVSSWNDGRLHGV
jgi:hypothetical protein